MSVEIELADAVVTRLNMPSSQATFVPFQFVARRTQIPSLELREITELQVLVIASEEVVTPVARDRDSHLVTVQVAVVQKLVARGLDEISQEIDALLDLVQRINDVCRTSLPGVSPAGWQGRSRTPLYDQQKLDEQHLFVSVTEQRYLTVRRVST